MKIFINGTECQRLCTGTDGVFRSEIALLPKDNKPTSYQLPVSFEGDDPSNVTAYEYTPNGTRYAACTTIQYGYKPSSNMVTLTVEPPATQAATASPDATVTQTPEDTTVTVPPAKTPEQMQAEAEQCGGLIIWHEFSWSYPWYRLHIRIHVNPIIDLGFNPVLPGGEVADWSGLEFFEQLMGEIVEEVLTEAMGLLGTYLLARTVGLAQPWIGTAMLAGKILAQAWLFLGDWNDALRILASGLVSIAMSFFAIVNFYLQPNIFMRFVDALWSICGSAKGALRWMLMKLTEIAYYGKLVSRTWMDAVEATADYTIGLIALLRYADLTT